MADSGNYKGILDFLKIRKERSEKNLKGNDFFQRESEMFANIEKLIKDCSSNLDLIKDQITTLESINGIEAKDLATTSVLDTVNYAIKSLNKQL